MVSRSEDWRDVFVEDIVAFECKVRIDMDDNLGFSVSSDSVLGTWLEVISMKFLI
jgi:hypothetical protein